jgi:hypothetical protein
MGKTRSRRRSSRRKKVAARWRFVTGFTLFALALAAAILFSSRPSVVATVSEADLPQAIVTPDLPSLPAAILDRPVYPHSIVDGGARSADELKQAIAKDPVVAAHYADFDLENTKVVRLEQPKLAHVSYRLGNAVYWSRKPLVIGAGETVLTDGVHIARARCANQLADMPGETSPVEPAQSVLDTPLPEAAAAAAQLPAMSPGVRRLSSAGDVVGPIGGSLLSTLLAGGGGLPSGGLQTAAGAATGIQAEHSANPGPPDDPGDPDGFPGIPSYFPVPPGGPMPPLDEPPNTPDTPEWLVPPETLLPPGSPVLPPDLFGPGDPGLPETPGVPEVVPVPEPGTALLMLGGAAAYFARRLKKKGLSAGG